jgi:hypothetical protein
VKKGYFRFDFSYFRMKKVKLTEDDRKWVYTIDYFFPVWLWLRAHILKIRRFFMIVKGVWEKQPKFAT